MGGGEEVLPHWRGSSGSLGKVCVCSLNQKVHVGFPGGSDGKASACNVGDPASIPRWGRSPGEGNGNHSSILAWKIPWMEEPGRLQAIRSQRVGQD